MIWRVVAAWLGRAWGLIAAIGAAAGVLLALMARERARGREQERQAQTEERLREMEIRDEVVRKNRSRPGTAVDRLRRSRWQRR